MKMTPYILFLLLCLPFEVRAVTARSIEEALSSRKTVDTLILSGGGKTIEYLSKDIGRVKGLKYLSIECFEYLKAIPKEIGMIESLEYLIIDNGDGCSMDAPLPEEIGNLKNLKEIKLWGAADKLGKKDNGKSLPASISGLPRLTKLDIGRNSLTHFPLQICGIKSLQVLVLDYNEFTSVPPCVESMPNLNKLSISSNGRIRLPDPITNTRGLKIFMGNSYLSLKGQDSLRSKYPKVTFNFDNDKDDNSMNEYLE